MSTIQKIVTLLNYPEILDENTYAFSINNQKLYKKWWDNGKDKDSLLVGSISKDISDEIFNLVKNNTENVLINQEANKELIIDGYRVLMVYPPISTTLVIDFYRLGPKGFPWKSVRHCIESKKYFKITKKTLEYKPQYRENTVEESGYDMFIGVKDALHRNLRHMFLVQGVGHSSGDICPVTIYELVGGDCVVVNHDHDFHLLEYLPKD